MRLFRWLIPLAVLIFAVVALPAFLSRGIPARVRNLGPLAITTFRTPDRIDIYRLRHEKGPSGFELPVRLVTPSILEDHVTPTAGWITRFKTWAQTPASQDMVACGEDPGFAIRFTRGADVFDFLVCLKCGQMAAQRPGDPIRNWEQMGDRPGIVALLAEAYPADQDLKEMNEAYKAAALRQDRRASR